MENERKRPNQESQLYPQKRKQVDSEGLNYSFLFSQDSIVDAPCAKWCRQLENGRYDLDEAQIKCLLSPDERKDQRLLGDILKGVLISGKVYPLIFEEPEDEHHTSIHLRSLPFFERLLADGDDGRARCQALSPDMKRIVGVGVRDLFLAAWQGHLDDDERRILDGMVKIVDETVGCSQVGGMNVSFFPSGNFKMLKFIEGLDEDIEPELVPFFAQVLDTPKLFAVFVDPGELSFHNFENIVPLDRWMESKRPQQELKVTLTNVQEVKEDRQMITCRIEDASNLIKRVAALDLYVPPLNKTTRGGERFIFHSALLSKALTSAIKSSNVLSGLHQGEQDLESTFEFVNYIFRCNKFAPGDVNFTSHRDTPYYDQSRSHVSKYTLLVYLTSGRGEPLLRVDDVEFNEIEEMTCVIFDQSAEHEGQPFIDNDKVFIRTELIFKDDSLDHDHRIASLFSEACYMTGHGVFDEELSRYAHDCFERANSLHWAVEREVSQSQPAVYLHKEFQGMHFMTNGYDYWFRRGRSINVVNCGMVAVLDYFNCKIDGKAFRHMSRGSPIRRQFAGTDEIWAFLSQQPAADEKEIMKRLTRTEVDSLVQKRATSPFVRREWSFEDDDDEEDTRYTPCCPFHSYREFNSWENKEVRDEYQKCWKYTRKKLFGAPLVFLGQEMRINESNIKVDGDKMFFLQDANTSPLPAFNFAACWNGVPPGAFIVASREVSAPELLIPPVLQHEYEDGFHLVLDIFRNDWMVKVDASRKIVLPVISNHIEEDEEMPTFWDRVGVSEYDAEDMSDASEEWEEEEVHSSDDLDVQSGGVNVGVIQVALSPSHASNATAMVGLRCRYNTWLHAATGLA